MIDINFEHADGRMERVRKVSPVQTRRGAEQYERMVRSALLDGSYNKKEIPTFDEWFNGRYWNEWVVARKNKPSTVEGKKSIYEHHLKETFGRLRLDEIRIAQIARFRAQLVEEKLSEKSINNILAVLSKPLHYAADVELIARAPKVGLFRVEAPEIVSWEMPEYARILDAARKEGAICYAAVCLAGEAGLRVGEVKGLRWREDVDLVAKTITVNQQMRKGIIGTPKGRTRRTVPMTSALYEALRSLKEVREGFVIRNLGGHALTNENQIKNMMYRVCRLAGLPERGWHTLRHSFGTHAAIFGINPWRLMTWMGHKRIDETMRYVHVASAHMRDLPKELLDAASSEHDPDRRVLIMLGARAGLAGSWQPDGNTGTPFLKVAGT
jgi:integrase